VDWIVDWMTRSSPEMEMARQGLVTVDDEPELGEGGGRDVVVDGAAAEASPGPGARQAGRVQPG
jgi:hypothetical protein